MEPLTRSVETALSSSAPAKYQFYAGSKSCSHSFGQREKRTCLKRLRAALEGCQRRLQRRAAAQVTSTAMAVYRSSALEETKSLAVMELSEPDTLTLQLQALVDSIPEVEQGASGALSCRKIRKASPTTVLKDGSCTLLGEGASRKRRPAVSFRSRDGVVQDCPARESTEAGRKRDFDPSETAARPVHVYKRRKGLICPRAEAEQLVGQTQTQPGVRLQLESGHRTAGNRIDRSTSGCQTQPDVGGATGSGGTSPAACKALICNAVDGQNTGLQAFHAAPAIPRLLSPFFKLRVGWTPYSPKLHG